MNLKVRLLTKTAKLPSRKHPTDAGLDLAYDGEKIWLFPGETRKLSTGIAIELWPNTVGIAKPRSGLASKHSIDVYAGVIDEGFTGEIEVTLHNSGQFPVEFERGDRIAQLLIMPVFYLEPVEVDELKSSDRGASGHGSTGR